MMSRGLLYSSKRAFYIHLSVVTLAWLRPKMPDRNKEEREVILAQAFSCLSPLCRQGRVPEVGACDPDSSLPHQPHPQSGSTAKGPFELKVPSWGQDVQTCGRHFRSKPRRSMLKKWQLCVRTRVLFNMHMYNLDFCEWSPITYITIYIVLLVVWELQAGGEEHGLDT